MTFSPVAEVHVSASVIDDDILVVMQCRSWESSQDIECPRGGHAHHQAGEASAQKIDLDGTPMEEMVVLEPLELSGHISGQ